MIRGIRGATTVQKDAEAVIAEATRELMQVIIDENGVDPDDVAGIIVTTTPDLHAGFPAKAIRMLPGWSYVPLLGSVEMDVQSGLCNCIRVLLFVNTEVGQRDIRHVFLRGAVALRPDLAGVEETTGA